jgi:glutamine amidotransferase
MCRHLAYVGPPIALGEMLVRPPHCLVDQARHARYQSSGDENPDGWGVGWFDEQGCPQRHRSATPIWSDPEADRLGREVTSGDFVAAVRLASPGAAIDARGNAPFVADGRWLFSFNGIVEGFGEEVGDELRALLSVERRSGIEGDSDSEVLFALVLDGLDAGRPPPDALADVVATVEERAAGRLNLLLSTRGATAATVVGNSLFHLGASLVASEPLDDDPSWERLADRVVVRSDGADLVVQAL